MPIVTKIYDFFSTALTSLQEQPQTSTMAEFFDLEYTASVRAYLASRGIEGFTAPTGAANVRRL